MKINEAIQEYLTECEIRKYTPRTLRSYRINLNLFARWCEEEKGITEMDEIKMPTTRQFAQFMIQKGKKGTYVNGLLKTIKSFLTYIWEEYQEGFDTKHGAFKWVKEEKPVVRAFKPNDVRKMLDNCKGADYLSVRDACILTIFFEAGIRCLELCSIKPEDIHDDFWIISYAPDLRNKYFYKIYLISTFDGVNDSIKIEKIELFDVKNKQIDANYSETTDKALTYPSPSISPSTDIELENHDGWVNTASSELLDLHNILTHLRMNELADVEIGNDKVEIYSTPELINTLEHQIKDSGLHCQVTEESKNNPKWDWKLTVFLK